MTWEPKWPFRSRDHVLAHEQAYLAGSITPQEGNAPIRLVKPIDLERERWLEQEGAERLRHNSAEREVVQTIYLWKMQSTAGTAIPPEILTDNFAQVLDQVIRSGSDDDMSNAMKCLIRFKGLKVRAASAFTYWLRPHEYQVIDKRVTSALNLQFQSEDYTPENYIRYCQLSRSQAAEQNLTLRQVDRALFVFNVLSSKQITI